MIRVAAALLCVAWLYAPTLSYEFVNADDTDLIVRNQVRLADWRQLPRAFERSYFETEAELGDVKSYYRPIVVATYMVDANRCGPDARCYHTTNVALHLVVVGLLFQLLRRSGISVPSALLASTIVGVHPVNAQAVAWVPGRNDILLAVFVLAAVHAWRWYQQRRTWGGVFALVAAYAGALFTKELAVALPLALIALQRWWCDRGAETWRRQLGRDGPLLAALGAMTAMWWVVRSFVLAGSTDGQSLVDLPATIIGRWPDVPLFVGKFLVPARLGTMPAADGWDIAIGGGAALVFAAVTWRAAPSRFIFGALWVLLFLAPTLAVPELPAYEHRAYVPLVGVAMVLAWLSDHRGWLRSYTGIGVSATIVLAFALAAAHHMQVFAAPEVYWTAGTARMPFAPIAHVNLGQLSEQRGEFSVAEQHYRRALELDPRTPKANNNLGVVLSRRREYREARASFERERALHPENPEAPYNLGVLANVTGESAAAPAFWRQAVQINPFYVPAYEQLIAYYELAGERAQAEEWRAALARARQGRR